VIARASGLMSVGVPSDSPNGPRRMDVRSPFVLARV